MARAPGGSWTAIAGLLGPEDDEAQNLELAFGETSSVAGGRLDRQR
ncbi:MAG: hypothetical protein M3Y09_17010 [Actinomycetota bacterium]|nr:hypothetical protein [Actinomycetota bacterium]